jgi:hypothetical protein
VQVAERNQREFAALPVRHDLASAIDSIFAHPSGALPQPDAFSPAKVEAFIGRHGARIMRDRER